MALTPCNTTVDGTRQELMQHGTVGFPIACYHDDLGKGEVPWHWHGELEAAVITEGCCTVAAGKEKFTLYPGEGFFINTQILHGCWDLEDSGCRFHSLVFHPRLVGGSPDSVFHTKFLQPLLENHGLEGLRLSPRSPWQARALEEIERAWQAVYREPAGYEFQARQALSELMLLLCENVDGTRQGTCQPRDGDRIKQMLQFIHDHCGSELRIADIARAAAVSESECLRCFRSTIGTTPIRYVRDYRIQRAARLLADTSLSVNEIAESCGFQDMSYFAKTFRELRGCSPTAYRRAEQEGL